MKTITRRGKGGVTAPAGLRRKRQGAAALLLAGLGTSLAAGAAQWDLRPFVNVGAVHDDNIQLTTGPHESTSGYVAGFRLDGERRTETSKTTFSGSIDHTSYSEGSVKDKTEHQLELNAEKQTSERGTLGLGAEYSRDTLFETATSERGTGDIRDVDIGLTSNTEVKRSYWFVQPSWNWLLTERSAVRVSYRRTDSSFDNAAGTGLVDYTDDLLSTTYARQLNPRDEFTASVNTARYRPETGGNDADTLQLLAGFGRKFSETLRGTFAVGASRTTTDEPAGADRSSGLVTTASLRQTSEISELEAVISRDVTPSGSGQALRTDQVRVWWSRRLSEQTEFMLDAQLFRARALEGEDPSVSRRYYEISPQLRWQWLEDLYIVTSYRYRRQKYDTQPDSADSNAVFLGLSYRL